MGLGRPRPRFHRRINKRKIFTDRCLLIITSIISVSLCFLFFSKLVQQGSRQNASVYFSLRRRGLTQGFLQCARWTLFPPSPLSFHFSFLSRLPLVSFASRPFLPVQDLCVTSFQALYFRGAQTEQLTSGFFFPLSNLGACIGRFWISLWVNFFDSRLRCFVPFPSNVF